jgi:large subunit ribosomal protein L10
VNRLTVAEFQAAAKKMGSCLIIGFDKVTVAQASDLRKRLREQNVRLRVVKNRLLVKAFGEIGLALPRPQGKSGVAFAPEEGAIPAAKLVRDFAALHKGIVLQVVGGIIEGQVISGADAKGIADMPDKHTVRGQLVGAILGPMRMLASALSGVSGGVARCLNARAEGKSGGAA